MKTDHPIRGLCEAFAVSASGYYGWLKRQHHPCGRQRQNQQLKERIAQIHQDSRQTYGAPRIQVCLQRQGYRHGRNRIGRLLREQHLCGRQYRRFRPVTTDSKHDQPVAPNRLSQRAAPRRPDEVWVADITYIATGQGWLYLAAILDRYSRRIVGWAMSSRLDTALVLSAWKMALCHRQPPAQLLFHSDRGVQYASKEFRQALAAAGAMPSMSRRANCYDNAMMEAFWSTLKLEWVYRQSWATHQQARQSLFDYIEVFYNRQRLHSALGYHSPAGFEHANN
jgi:transposase InsO family protein